MISQLPEWAVWLDVLLARDGLPVRHRVLYGGRGGGKSWTIAHKLVEKARRAPHRILCTREFQNSIRDSSKKLIENIIDRLGWGSTGDGFFSITDREIKGRNGSVFTFLGLNGKEASIKSLEGYDLAWVEEAATLSQASIDALTPTIRRDNSEIWWSYNPRYAMDPVNQMFRLKVPPPGSVVIAVQHNDNPWFPRVLAREMEFDRGRDPEKYAHVWEGGYVERSEAIVFKNWIQAPFETPPNANFLFGADWGYAVDPTVLVRCFIGRWLGDPGTSEVVADSNGSCLFIDFEAHDIGCAIEDTPALFAGTDRRHPPRWPNTSGRKGIPEAGKCKIVADSARPETIDYMVRRGFNIVGAKKGPGSVEDGIAFLNNYDIVVHPRCRHLYDELVRYSWAIDRQTGEILPRLADSNNHVIDALRYALEGVRGARLQPLEWLSAGPRLSLTSSLPDFEDIIDANGQRNQMYLESESGW